MQAEARQSAAHEVAELGQPLVLVAPQPLESQALELSDVEAGVEIVGDRLEPPVVGDDERIHQLGQGLCRPGDIAAREQGGVRLSLAPEALGGRQITVHVDIGR